jgi:hypothetical protein
VKAVISSGKPTSAQGAADVEAAPAPPRFPSLPGVLHGISTGALTRLRLARCSLLEGIAELTAAVAALTALESLQLTDLQSQPCLNKLLARNRRSRGVFMPHPSGSALARSLTRLTPLELDSDAFTEEQAGDLQHIRALTTLQALELRGRSLRTSDVAGVGQLQQLTRLCVRSCRWQDEQVLLALTGATVPGLGQLSVLRHLELEADEFESRLLLGMGQLTSLELLGAMYVRDENAMPHISQLTQLEHLAIEEQVRAC